MYFVAGLGLLALFALKHRGNNSKSVILAGLACHRFNFLTEGTLEIWFGFCGPVSVCFMSSPFV